MKYTKTWIDPLEINGSKYHEIHDLVSQHQKLLMTVLPPDEKTFSPKYKLFLNAAASDIVQTLKWIDTHRTFADDNDSAVRLASDYLGDYAINKDALELLRIKRESLYFESDHDFYVRTAFDLLYDEYPYRYELDSEPDPSSVFKSVENHYRVRELKDNVSVRKAVGNDPRMLAILATLQGQAPQHSPAVQAEATPKGSGGNTRRTKHRQGLAKRLIHELFEQHPDKSGGDICRLLESSSSVKAGWRVERHVGNRIELDDPKKDTYIIDSDDGNGKVTAGTIDTWLSNYRKKVK